MALTATADDTTRLDIARLLGLNDPYIQVSSFDRPNIRYADGKFKPLDQLLRYVQEQRGKSGIICRNSRAKVEDTAARLQNRGFSAAAYHAGLENHIRAAQENLKWLTFKSYVLGTVAVFGMASTSFKRALCGISTSRATSNSLSGNRPRRATHRSRKAMLFYDPADTAYCAAAPKRNPGQLQDIERHKLSTRWGAPSANPLPSGAFNCSLRSARSRNRDICLIRLKQYDGSMDA